LVAGSGFAGSGVGVGVGALLEVTRLKSSVILVMTEAMIGCFLAPSAGWCREDGAQDPGDAAGLMPVPLSQ
jgi:hypothetical protein